MPDVPMPVVNGQVVGSPAAHASMSISSFAPAASTSGLFGSTAKPGSFCLFCANGVMRLPMDTRVSAAKDDPAAKRVGDASVSSASFRRAAPSEPTMIAPCESSLNLPCVKLLRVYRGTAGLRACSEMRASGIAPHALANLRWLPCIPSLRCFLGHCHGSEGRGHRLSDVFSAVVGESPKTRFQDRVDELLLVRERDVRYRIDRRDKHAGHAASRPSDRGRV